MRFCCCFVPGSCKLIFCCLDWFVKEGVYVGRVFQNPELCRRVPRKNIDWRSRDAIQCWMDATCSASLNLSSYWLGCFCYMALSFLFNRISGRRMKNTSTNSFLWFSYLILHKKICEHDQALIILMQIYIYIYIRKFVKNPR